MSALADRLAKLDPRERTLLTALAALAGALLVIVPPIVLAQRVGEARDEAQAIRDVLEKIDASRDKIAKRRASRDALLARYAKDMPGVSEFVEETAKANNVEIAESQARPDVPHGKKYVEHTVSLKLRQAGLYGLTKMLERIEKSGHPVSLSKLNLKPRNGEKDSYDVELHVAAFERKDSKPKKTEEAPAADGGETP